MTRWRKCHPDAAVIVPPRRTAVSSEMAAIAPTPRDCRLACIAEKGRMVWQKTSGYSRRAKVEAAIGRWKQGIGDGLRSRVEACRASEVEVAVDVLNRMLALGRPERCPHRLTLTRGIGAVACIL